MWLAHALTLARLPLGIALVWAYGHPAWTVGLVAAAAATDVADGNVARAMQRRGHTTPDIGGWLDPLVDKVFVVIVLATIAWHTRDLVVVALIAAREIAMVPLAIAYLVQHRPLGHLHARPLGKTATIVQLTACAVALAHPPWALPVAIAAAVVGVAAVIDYIPRRPPSPAPPG